MSFERRDVSQNTDLLSLITRELPTWPLATRVEKLEYSFNQQVLSFMELGMTLLAAEDRFPRLHSVNELHIKVISNPKASFVLIEAMDTSTPGTVLEVRGEDISIDMIKGVGSTVLWESRTTSKKPIW